MGRFFCLSLVLGYLSWPMQALGASKGVAPQIPVKSPEPAVISFNNFKELQGRILSAMGSAKHSIYLVTDFLTDGEISSALYLAKYRKIKVKVFLSSRRLNQYLSRANFLKEQGVPLGLRPKLALKDPTLLLIDHRLYRISRDLDVLNPRIPGRIMLASPRQTQLTREILSKSPNNVKIVTRPYLPSARRKPYQKPSSRQWGEPYTGNRDGSYDYNRAPASQRPQDVPTTLPKVPKYQRLSEERLEWVDEKGNNEDDEAETSTDGDNKIIKGIELIPSKQGDQKPQEPFLEDRR